MSGFDLKKIFYSIKLKCKFLFLEQPKYTLDIVKYILPLCPVILLEIIYLPTQTGLLSTYICYKQPQYFGEKIYQFHFVSRTDYKHFQADEQQMLITTTTPSIPPIYSCYCCAICSCFQNIFSAYTFFNKVQS